MIRRFHTCVGLLLLLVAGPVAAELPARRQVAPNPGIAFTSVPDWGSTAWLRGTTWGADPDEYGVAVYISIGGGAGWWTKPYSYAPLATLSQDGDWAVDITTGGVDSLAITIAAYLVPLDYEPPVCEGCWDLPDLPYPRVVECRSPGFRRLDCLGREWIVKSADLSRGPVGPGPNYFSDADSMVWCDESGLNMRMAPVDGVWHSTEVVAAEPSAYGEYVFTVNGAVDELDATAVLGLFTWDTCGPLDRRNPEPFYREIDVEVSRWNNPWDPNNTQFVIQPWWRPANIFRFPVDVGPDLTSEYGFTWREDRVDFFSTVRGSNVQWRFEGADVPAEGPAHARINLWQSGESPPAVPQKVVIQDFQFRPLLGRSSQGPNRSSGFEAR